MPALLSAYRDMAHALIDAKRAQVEALNDVGLSLDEYRWIRSEAYRALGIPLVDVDIAQDIRAYAKRRTARHRDGRRRLDRHRPRVEPQARREIPEAARGLHAAGDIRALKRAIS